MPGGRAQIFTLNIAVGCHCSYKGAMEQGSSLPPCFASVFPSSSFPSRNLRLRRCPHRPSFRHARRVFCQRGIILSSSGPRAPERPFFLSRSSQSPPQAALSKEWFHALWRLTHLRTEWLRSSWMISMLY